MHAWGLNSGIAFAVSFGIILAFLCSLVVKEWRLETTMIALPAVSTASTGFVLGGSSWSDLLVTYPGGRQDTLRQDYPVHEGSQITVYMVPDAPNTLRRSKPDAIGALSRIWWVLTICLLGFSLGVFLIRRAIKIKRDAKEAKLNGTPYSAAITHIGTVWLPGTFRFVGYVAWKDRQDRTARSMVLSIAEKNQFSVGDLIIVKSGRKREWLQSELDLLP